VPDVQNLKEALVYFKMCIIMQVPFSRNSPAMFLEPCVQNLMKFLN